MRRRHVDVKGSDRAPAPARAGDEEDLPPDPAADATGDTAPPPVEAPEEQREYEGDEPDVAGAADVAARDDDGAAALRRELDEVRDKYLRLAAEYDNYRRRMARERSEAGERAQAALTKELLDALDDLARFAHLDPAVTDAATVVEGAALVERKLHKALAGAGLEIVDPLGKPFDPEQHEAVATEPALNAREDHTVGRVFQRGYMFKGQLLRPARVVVRQWQG